MSIKSTIDSNQFNILNIKSLDFKGDFKNRPTGHYHFWTHQIVHLVLSFFFFIQNIKRNPT